MTDREHLTRTRRTRYLMAPTLMERVEGLKRLAKARFRKTSLRPPREVEGRLADPRRNHSQGKGVDPSSTASLRRNASRPPSSLRDWMVLDP